MPYESQLELSESLDPFAGRSVSQIALRLLSEQLCSFLT